MTRREFGNIRQTASGRWHCRYTAPDGTHRPIGKTFRTKTEAQTALNTIRYEMERGIWLDPKAPRPTEPAKVPTLREYVDHFHVARAGKRGGVVKPKTRASTESQLRDYILPTFGDIALDKITVGAVNEWHGNLQNPAHTPHPWKKDERGRSAPISSSLVRQCYSLLNGICNMAVREEVIPRSPCRIRGGCQNRYPKPDYMSPDQAHLIIRKLSGDLVPLAMLALATGARLGELLALTWADIHLDHMFIDVRRAVAEVEGQQAFTTTKTEETREIDIDTDTVAVLKALGQNRACQPTDRLFVSSKGLPLRHRQVQAAWRRARMEAGVVFTFHHLRHTHLTLLAYEGRPIQEVMARAGHASFAAAMNYQRLATRVRRVEGPATA